MSFENTLLTLYHSMPFGASLLAGILTFLSPCLLPLIPPYISYISGVGISQIQNEGTIYKKRIIATSILFVAGFCFVFIIFGIFASSALGAFFSSSWIRYIAGGIIILFGIHFLSPFQHRFFYKYLQPKLNHTRFGFLSPFVLGIGFSIGWSPCVGPILASILTLSLSEPTNALWLMLFYCIGLGLPFVLLAFFIEGGLKFLKKITPFLRIIEVIAGILLIIIGILVVVRKTDFLIP